MTHLHRIDRCTAHRASVVAMHARAANTLLMGATTLIGLDKADKELAHLIENAKAAKAGIRRLRSEAVRVEKQAERDRRVIERDRVALEARG